MNKIVSNNGIGSLYGTFNIAMKNDCPTLTIDDIGKAVTLAGNNTVYLGCIGDFLLGRLEHVSMGLATVQIGGVVRLDLTKRLRRKPCIGGRVLVDGIGGIYGACSGKDFNGRGTVLSINDDNTCEILIT